MENKSINLHELIIENFDRVDLRYQALLVLMTTIMVSHKADKIGLDLAAQLLSLAPAAAGEEFKEVMADTEKLVRIFCELTKTLEAEKNQ